MSKCKLPECNNLVRNWRMSCCCRSHQGRYSALVRHKVLIHTPRSITDLPDTPKEIYVPPIDLLHKTQYRIQKAAAKATVTECKGYRRSLGKYRQKLNKRVL